MSGHGARPNSATRALVAERRRQAVELRHAGTDPVTIGRTLHYGRWANEPPGELTADERAGWDWGEQLSTDRQLSVRVSQDIGRAFADRREGLAATVDAKREESRARLERLRAACWTRAVGGSVKHAAEVRKIEHDLARLDGLYAPVRVELPDVPAAAAVVEEAVGNLLTLLRDTAPPAGVVVPLREQQ